MTKVDSLFQMHDCMIRRYCRYSRYERLPESRRCGSNGMQRLETSGRVITDRDGDQ